MKSKITLLFTVLIMCTSQISMSEERSVNSESKNLIGEWDFFLPTPDGVEKVLAKFKGESGAYKGSFEGKKGLKNLHKVNIEGQDFSFQHEVEKFFLEFTVEFSGVVEGDHISGFIDTPKGLKSFKGIRRDL